MWSDTSGRPLADLPTNATDNVSFPGVDSVLQTITMPYNLQEFALGLVSGDLFYRLEVPDEPKNGRYKRTLTIDDASQFEGAWISKSVESKIVFSGKVAAPSVSAVDTSNRYYIDTPDGVSASLDATYGVGHLVKLGAGSLKVEGTLSQGNQQITVSEGTLELGGKSKEGPASTPVFWVAADKEDSLVKENIDGVDYVSEWRDVRYADGVNTIAAKSMKETEGVERPRIKPDALAGKPVVDFGALRYNNNMWDESTDKGTPSSLRFALPDNIKEWYVVWEDVYPDNPAFIVGQDKSTYNFHRGVDGESGNLFHYRHALPAVRDGLIFLDGDVATYASKPHFGKYHLLGMTLLENGAKPVYFANDRTTTRVGGVRIAEVIFYTNRLSYAEKVQTTRYLAEKWNDTEKFTMSKGDANNLAMSAGTSLKIEKGHTASVRQLTLKDNVLNKKGEGILKVGRIQSSPVTLNIEGGAVKFDADDAVLCRTDAPAEGAIFWGDATKDCFVFTNGQDNATQYAVRWNDCRGDGYAYAQAFSHCGYAPFLKDNACNQLRVLDFGDYNAADPYNGTSSWYEISCGDKIVETYEIICIKKGTYAPNIIGGSNQGYLRESSNYILNPSHVHHSTVAGFWTVNGNTIDPCEQIKFKDNEWYVVSAATKDADGAHIIGGDRPASTKEAGDIMIGEIICYDRHLTDAERRQTIAYLMKRWKNETYMFAKSPSAIDEINFTEENTNPILIADVDTTVKKMTSPEGSSLTKLGAGEIVVDGSIPEEVSNISVSNGTLSVNMPFVLFPDAAFHVDAMEASSFTFREGQEEDKRIDKWYDCRKNGLYASTPMLPVGVADGALTNAVLRVGTDLDGIPANKPYVDFLTQIDGVTEPNVASGMRWYNADGSEFYPKNVREFHVVFMIQDSESWINATPIGSHKYHTDADGLVPKGSTEGGYYKNSVNVGMGNKRTDGSAWFTENRFTADGSKAYGKFLVMTIAATGNVSACSFAIDRKNCGRGGVKLCEAIVFTGDTNTTARAEQIHNYLLAKWKNIGQSELKTRMYEKVYVASGAELNIAEKVGGNTQIKSVAGAGTINVGDVSGLESLDVVFDENGQASCLEFDSQVSFADAVNLVITAQNESNIKEGVYTVLNAAGISNVDLTRWTIEKPETALRNYSVVYNETTIKIRVSALGTLLIVK